MKKWSKDIQRKGREWKWCGDIYKNNWFRKQSNYDKVDKMNQEVASTDKVMHSGWWTRKCDDRWTVNNAGGLKRDGVVEVGWLSDRINFVVHHHHLPSSMLEGQRVIYLQMSLFTENLLTFSYSFFFIYCTISSIYVLGQPVIFFPSNFSSRTSKALTLSLIHIWRCRRIERCRSRWSPYH